MQVDTDLDLEGVPTYDGTPGYNVESFEGNNFVSVSYETVELGSDDEATLTVVDNPDADDPVSGVKVGDGGAGTDELGDVGSVSITAEDGDAAPDGPPALAGFENAPTDPDGDGRYEDVNGNGAATLADVTALFGSLDDPAVTNNPAAFDYTGNGNGDLTLADVTALFETVGTGPPAS